MSEHAIRLIVFDVVSVALLAPLVRVAEQLSLGCLILVVGIKRVVL